MREEMSAFWMLVALQPRESPCRCQIFEWDIDSLQAWAFVAECSNTERAGEGEAEYGLCLCAVPRLCLHNRWALQAMSRCPGPFVTAWSR